jgi:GNAT superfamily N-acetyltransferase
MTIAAQNSMHVFRADDQRPAGSRADGHWLLAGEEEVRGSCSAWWNNTPALQGARVGIIGNYTMHGPAGGELLDEVCRHLARQGCTVAVGPMDGSTWRNYRLTTWQGDEPWFALEPDNPPEWPRQFVSCGFTPLARYFSALNENLRQTDPRVERQAQRLSALGITIRPIARDRLADDLRKIWNVARQAFAGNLLYSELSEQEFFDLTGPLVERVPLELVLLAEEASRPVGFVFALPDFREALRGAPPRTIVVKTLAALSSRRTAGVGQALLARVQQQALALGFERAIHALVRDTGPLRRISARTARPIREYTLFAKALGP